MKPVLLFKGFRADYYIYINLLFVEKEEKSIFFDAEVVLTEYFSYSNFLFYDDRKI